MTKKYFLHHIFQATIKRENNFRDFKSAYDIDTAPKYGEGSQFGKEQKDEARRKKFGMLARKYNPNDQPWVVTLGSGKEARKYVHQNFFNQSKPQIF